MIFKAYCRTYQKTLYAASQFLPWRKPIVLEGPDSLLKLPELISQENVDQVLIVTDQGIRKLGMMDGLLEGLEEKGISYAVFDQTVPDPMDTTVEAAVKMYRKNHCKGIIAFGGGSPMDCAKGVGARLVQPKKTMEKMGGLLKIHKKLPPLYAVPTTAGTGSEATIAAVITDSESHIKYQVDDIVLVPHAAVLDAKLTVGLPPKITAATGMDALTHAVEAYIGNSNTKETKDMSIRATRLIFENLYTAYSDGENLEARTKMLRASHYAGIAFTRAYVGYVHALAHALGGMYHIPHGLANAVLLPYVLEYYGRFAEQKLSELCDAVHLTRAGASPHTKAKKFIDAVWEFNRKMDIPAHFDEIRREDIPELARRANKEANPLYPVPKIFSRRDFEAILKKVGRFE